MQIITKIVVIGVLIAFSCIGLLVLSHIHLSEIMSGNNNKIAGIIDTVIPSNNISMNQLGNAHNFVTIHAVEPTTPSSLPLYHAEIREGDLIDKEFDDLFKNRTNVISETDAPTAAIKALEPYGGLPPDAKLSKVEMNVARGYNSTTWEVIAEYPLYTNVFYYRTVDGLPVVGSSDMIVVSLGENGKLLELRKIWRTLTKTGDMNIIPPRSATEKLRNGEVIDRPQNVSNVTITDIKLQYYEKSRTDKEIFLEPVWAFQGTTSAGSPEEFFVYARHYANFTQTPVGSSTSQSVSTTSFQGSDNLTVRFSDTSGANPIKWSWDFGDDTNSTEQNPTHTYSTAGTYNVTLTVWNDLGSDTMTQQYTAGS